ncbi:MAG: polysaccharide biosynthesis protein [Gammaproteobacteria bacterium]|nr:polysaccharide biosynthesis protein [Gammaproteobacteria bacterium]
MSKIEDALKKAKHEQDRIGNQSTSLVRRLSGSRPAVQHNREIVSHSSSAREIALMNDGESIDNKTLSELKIIYSEMHDTQVANTYRGLRTALMQKSNGQNFVVMITSCSSETDDSNICLNMANSFAFDESKTSLIIDCNLNSPKIDSILSIDTGYGLTDYLENENLDLESIIYRTGIKRLRAIPVGTSRETSIEYFTSKKMRQLMEELLHRYSDRYIFIDSAPIAESADTRILIELCDYVVLVVPYGTCTVTKIKSAVDAIGKDRLLGLVFSEIPPGIRKIRKLLKI